MKLIATSLLLSHLLSANIWASEDMGGISSGGDDPTRWMSCTVKNTKNEVFFFSLGTNGPHGLAGNKEVFFFNKEGKEVKNEKTVKMKGVVDVDFDSGELTLNLSAHKIWITISPKPVERGANFYYSGTFASGDHYFRGIERQKFTCEMYTQKCAGTDCDGGIEIK